MDTLEINFSFTPKWFLTSDRMTLISLLRALASSFLKNKKHFNTPKSIFTTLALFHNSPYMLSTI